MQNKNWFVVLFITLFLVGCGTKGPLYLPEKDSVGTSNNNE